MQINENQVFCVVLGRQNNIKYNCGGCLESEFDKLAVLECQNPLFYKGFVTLEIPDVSSTPSAPF